MTRMAFDGLTAKLIEPAIAEHGWTLKDLATSLRNALSGTSHQIYLKELKRHARAADFVIGEGVSPTHLLTPECDAFTPPEDCRPMEGVPAMWGSLVRIDDRYELRPTAIRCHRDILAMPSRHTGRFLITGHALPEAIKIAAAGKPLASVVTVEGVDFEAFRIKAIRDAIPKDFDRVRLTNNQPGSTATTLGETGLVIAVKAGPVVAVEF